MCQKGRNRRSVIDSTRQNMSFLVSKSEFVDHLLEVFHVSEHDNHRARVMFPASSADFVSQLLELFMVPGGTQRCR